MELSVVSLGHLHTTSIEPLTAHLAHLEQVMTSLAPRVELASVRAELNRAIDAAAHDWILIVREREFVDGALATEIASVMQAADAWGFRVRVVPLYAGKPLRLGGDAGEVRLFHRRHLLRRGELGVQGTVVRLRNAMYARTFDSSAEHREYLAKNAVPHSWLRRALLFVRNARTFDANTLRYVWIESGYDQS
jgi:hypothetical protein